MKRALIALGITMLFSTAHAVSPMGEKRDESSKQRIDERYASNLSLTILDEHNNLRSGSLL